MKYLRRIADNVLQDNLDASGTVLIEGPKWCGKTTTASQRAKSWVVLHMGDGKYALIECKLGSTDIEEGAQHLLKVRDLIRKYNETEKQVPLREPDYLIILTGGEMAYTRKDGVKIIPLACLKD